MAKAQTAEPTAVVPTAPPLLPQRRAPDPVKPLNSLQRTGLMVLLPVLLTMFVVGVVGMQILMDHEDKKALSRTSFGVNYKKLIQINPFFSAFFVNGGLIGLLLVGVKLFEDAKAVKALKEAKKEE